MGISRCFPFRNVGCSDRRVRILAKPIMEVTFVDVDVWGRQAETIGQYMAKGRPIFIEGRLKLDQWDDKESGQKRSKLKVVCENFQFIGAPKGAGGSGEISDQPPAAKPARPRPAPAPAAEEAPAGEGEDNIPF